MINSYLIEVSLKNHLHSHFKERCLYSSKFNFKCILMIPFCQNGDLVQVVLMALKKSVCVCELL